MKWLLIFSSFILQTEIFCQQFNRQQLRDLFLQATDRKTALDSLATKLEAIENKTPAEESYYGMCNGLYCQYDDGNWAKLKHVIKSKNHLNSAVERDAKDPELRFLRVMLEHFLPSYLGLNKHIAEDLNVIFANPHFIDDNSSLKKKIIEFLLWSERCTAEQSKLLQAQMDELNKKLNPVVVKKNG